MRCGTEPRGMQLEEMLLLAAFGSDSRSAPPCIAQCPGRVAPNAGSGRPLERAPRGLVPAMLWLRSVGSVLPVGKVATGVACRRRESEMSNHDDGQPVKYRRMPGLLVHALNAALVTADTVRLQLDGLHRQLFVPPHHRARVVGILAGVLPSRWRVRIERDSPACHLDAEALTESGAQLKLRSAGDVRSLEDGRPTDAVYTELMSHRQ